MPIFKFFEYLNWFEKNWQIANLANFVFRHKQQVKVILEKALKYTPINFSSLIFQFLEFFESLKWFVKKWQITNFANFVFRHKQQE